MKKIKHIIEYTAVILLLPLLSAIPYRLRISIGDFLGLALYFCYKKRRDIAMENISNSFPDMDEGWHKRTCRNSFRHFGMNAMEFLQLPKFNSRFTDKYFEMEGRDHIDNALKKGKGIVGICPHLGNWEYVAAYVGLKGYPLSVIMKRQSNPYVSRLIEKIRSGLNMELIYKSEAGFPVLRALKVNRIIGFVADQDAGRNGVFVDFFGRKASTAQGPARFALSQQSPVIIFFGIRKGKGGFKIVVSPVREFDYNINNKGDAVSKNTGLWVKGIENYIKQYPDQYFWMHRRWKTRQVTALKKCGQESAL